MQLYGDSNKPLKGSQLSNYSISWKKYSAVFFFGGSRMFQQKKKHADSPNSPSTANRRLLPPVEGEGLLGLLEKDPSLPVMSRASGDAQLETPRPII